MNILTEKRMGPKSKAALVAVAAGALVLGGGTAAHAEGGFDSYMTQVQPSFHSRDWADKNRDSAHTVIKLTNCKVNLGGKNPGSTAVKSVEISFGNTQYSKKITHKCGTYDFGRVPASNINNFYVWSINGVNQPGAKIFLNADVSVSY